jgi:hypothetical protein
MVLYLLCPGIITHFRFFLNAADIETAIDCSTSSLANKLPEKFDVFAQLCVAGPYVSNTRLNHLVELPVDNEQVMLCKHALERSLQYVDRFRSISGGSESALVDPNLQSMLT